MKWGSPLQGDEDGEVAPPEADCGAELQAHDSTSTASASAFLERIMVAHFATPPVRCLLAEGLMSPCR